MIIIYIAMGFLIIGCIVIWQTISEDISGKTNERQQRIEENIRKLDEAKKELQDRLAQYIVDKEFRVHGGDNGQIVSICQSQKKVLIYKPISAMDVIEGKPMFFEEIPFETIINCELLEDNATIMEGGVGRAVVGAAIAGGVGAIVGASTRSSSNIANSMCVRIITSDILKPYHPITIIDSPTNRNDSEYKRRFDIAQEIYATIIAIICNNGNEQ